MRLHQFTFNGTGAAVYLLCGFIPDFVEVTAVGNSGVVKAVWNRGYRVAASVNGILLSGGTGATSLYTAGGGIVPYEGGELLTATNQTSTGFGEGVFLAADPVGDYRYAAGLGLHALQDAIGQTIDRWTLDHTVNRTGHFNADVTGGYIGAGSRIWIKDPATKWLKVATITALTAGTGVSANEVTLDRAVPDGIVERITGKWDYAPLAIGKVTGQGFKLNATTGVNVNDEMQSVVCGTYD